MKPQLSEKERAALLSLGQTNPAELDAFSRHIRSEIGRLSMVIEQGQGKVDRLKSDLGDAEDGLKQDVGAFQATARTYLAYMQSQGETPIPGMPGAVANVAPAPSPQEAPGDAEAPEGTPTPAEPETPEEAPEGASDAAENPKPESD